MPKIFVEMASNESLWKYFAQCVVNGNLDIYIDQFAPLTGKLDFFASFFGFNSFLSSMDPSVQQTGVAFLSDKILHRNKIDPHALGQGCIAANSLVEVYN